VPRSRTLLVVYAGFLLLVVLWVRTRYGLESLPPGAQVAVDTVFRAGEVHARRVGPVEEPVLPGAVRETIVGRARLPTHPVLLALSLAPLRDGVEAQLGDHRAVCTPEELKNAGAYDRALSSEEGPGVGVRVDILYALLGRSMGIKAHVVERDATLFRARFAPAPAPQPSRPTASAVRTSVREAAWHLARNVDGEGRYRYLVSAPSNQTLFGYNYARHAGATLFLAQVAATAGDADLTAPLLRAAAFLRERASLRCGEHRCIAEGTEATMGASAIATMAFAELVRTGLDASYLPALRELTAFLRSMQRPDGEFQHVYDVAAKAPVNVQYMYFTGEASLALALAYEVTGDARDLHAASRALGHLVAHGWSFPLSAYYQNEEHWTCQAMAQLWRHAPNPEALSFCLRWNEFQRAVQYVGGAPDPSWLGGYGVGTVMLPRLTPAASRSEATAATLAILLSDKGHVNAEQAQALRAQLDLAVSFLLRQQITAEGAASYRDALAVQGAFPGSAADLDLRIDYAQHAGAALLRWLALEGSGNNL
jgi:hypothetical protein